MALDFSESNRERRPVGFVLVGVALLAIAGWILLDVRSRSVDTVNLPSVYEYKINQNVATDVSYKDSQYYDGTPGFGNTAYVASLADTINAKFHYEYQATREADLTWTYLAVSTMSAQYTLGSDGKDVNNVWSKDERSIPAKVETGTVKSIVLDKEVSVPFSAYRDAMEQYQASLQLPVTTEMQILFSVHVTGTIDGSPIDDTRTSVVSAPLNQPIFKISNQFDKDDTKQVAGKAAIDTQASLRNTERIAAAIVGILGAGAIVYGMRRQIFKSAYQRELDKIYRYHDGIIIRASKPVNLTDKHITVVQSFDDMLNLEEEMKTPIVASQVSTEATRFTIVSGDDAYTYTLGKVLVDEDKPEQASVFDDTDNPHSQMRHKR